MEPPKKTLKTYFITGLVLLMPVTLTLAIVIFVINLLTEPFVGLVKGFLDYYNLLERGFLFLNADQVQRYFSKVIIIALLFFCTVALGYLARWLFFHYFLGLWEKLLRRIPVISSIYKTSQDVINTLFTANSSSFKQVVLVPFPIKTTLTIGFITRENLPLIGTETEPRVGVFIPTAPNPSSGYLVMFKKEELQYVDMKVEDALKYVISCGITAFPSSEESTPIPESSPR